MNIKNLDNKQTKELRILGELRNGYIDIRRKYVSKRDRYHAFLALLNRKGYSKNFLTEYISDVSGKEENPQYVGKLINQINRKRGESK